MGAKIQCTSCYTAYHPLCARLAGLHMEILDGGDSGEEVPVSPACPHCPDHRYILMYLLPHCTYAVLYGRPISGDPAWGWVWIVGDDGVFGLTSMPSMHLNT